MVFCWAVVISHRYHHAHYVVTIGDHVIGTNVFTLEPPAPISSEKGAGCSRLRLPAGFCGS